MTTNSSDAESRARNAARDTADSFLRFERDLDRMLRHMKDLPRSVQRKALAQACDASDRARAMNTILNRMEESRGETSGSR